MNPYLLDLAKEHQAEALCEVDTEHQLKTLDRRETVPNRRGSSPVFLLILVVNIFLGFFRKHG